MNQAHPYIKWFYRFVLLTLFLSMTYLATRSSYNMAHWVPHNALRELGVSYQQLLWFEHHTDLFLHFFGSLLLTLLLFGADLPLMRQKAAFCLAVVIGLCVLTEFVQHSLGRGFESKDLLLGIFGSFMAYLAIHKNKKAKTQTPDVTSHSD